MTKTMRIISIAAVAVIPFISNAAEYKIDAAHSNVGFSVRHLLTKTQGRFDKFSGAFTYDEKDPKSWKTETTIEAASINTNEAKRDAHLRAKDFFDVDNAKMPENKTLKFVSTKVTDVKGKKAKLHGKLTIHSITKDVVFDLEALGIQKDPWGNVAASFTATTKVNRKDYGLTWNQALEAGGVLVGEEVEITLDIAGLLQEAPKAEADKSAKK